MIIWGIEIHLFQSELLYFKLIVKIIAISEKDSNNIRKFLKPFFQSVVFRSFNFDLN